MIQKILPLIGLLFCANILSAQKNKMILYFENGDQITGYGKLVSEKKIKFKKNKKDKSEKLAFDDLKGITKIKYYKVDDIIIYEFIKINENKIKLLELTAQGRINLYKRVRFTGGAFYPQAAGGVWVPTTVEVKNYYVKRKDEPIATHLGSNQLFTKNFKKAISEYLEDCPKLVEKVESGEYKKKHLIEIIEFYNENCNE